MVLCVWIYVGDSFFVVFFGDDFIDECDLLLIDMIVEYECIGVVVVVLMEVDFDSIYMYGVVVVELFEGFDVVWVMGFVEKFVKEDVFFNFVIIGCYVFLVFVFDIFECIELGKGGEI